MSLEALPVVSYMAWLASAAIPSAVAYKTRTLYLTDLALFIAPVVGFLVALGLFNEPALTGWAFLVYPILLLALSVAVLHARVFLLPRLGLSARTASRGALAVTLLVGIALGTFVEPLHE